MSPWRMKTILALPILAILWAALLIQSSHDRKQALEAANTNTANLARAFEENVEKTVQNIDGLLLQLRSEYSLKPEELTDVIHRLALHKATAKLLIQVTVIDRQGMMAYNTRGLPAKPLDLSDREHFKVHLAEQADTLFISKPVLGRVSKKWSIQFTRKIFDRANRFSGVMVLSIDPEYFSGYYNTIDVGPKGVIALAGMDRIIRARASKVAIDFEPKGILLPADLAYFDSGAPPTGNVTIVSPVDKIERIGAYRRLAGYPLLVVVAQAKEDVLTKTNARATNLLIAGIIFSIAIVIVTWYFWREERRKAEMHETLADNEELFRTLFNQFPIGTALVDKNCRANRVNQEFSRISGYTDMELSEINIFEIIRPAEKHSFLDDCSSENGITLIQAEATCINKNGSQIPTMLTASPVFLQNGELRFSILTLQDITGLKDIESELIGHQAQLKQLNMELEERIADEVSKNRQKDGLLLQQDKMASIGQLAAGVAHEINNPMGFITSNLGALGKYIASLTQFCTMLQTLVFKCGTDEDQAFVASEEKKLKIKYILNDINSLIEESTEGAERVRKIVLDLKDFARADEKGMKAADINECITSTVNMVRNEIKYIAELDLQLGKLPQVNCSPNQINQVIANLLINAAHAIDKQGTIRVTTRQENENVVLSISDTGAGMTDEVKNRIFEPFFTTKEVGKGTGLGLTICYDIIKKHNGSITVDSEPGRGTEFTIVLPICGNSDFHI